MDNGDTERDPFRELPLRYLGYANEVGEAFRSWVHVYIVRASYGIATSYVIADAIHKGRVTSKKSWPAESRRRAQVGCAVIDTFIWQGLASVVIPGFTINRMCALCHLSLARFSKLPLTARKTMTTIVGLACIPFIIHPIDRSVDWFMDNTFRTYQYKLLEKTNSASKD